MVGRKFDCNDCTKLRRAGISSKYDLSTQAKIASFGIDWEECCEDHDNESAEVPETDCPYSNYDMV